MNDRARGYVSIFVFSLVIGLSACTTQPPVPDWQSRASEALARGQQDYLSGQVRRADQEFKLALSELSRTGQPGLIARAMLIQCALRLATADLTDCGWFEQHAAEATAEERAYGRYLWQVPEAQDVSLLPRQYQLLAAGGTSPSLAIAAMDEPVSRLIAAGVMLRRGQADPGVIALAVETASAQGWRRAVIGWLSIQEDLARRTGDRDTQARAKRRLETVGQP